MMDEPTPPELLGVIADFLRTEVMPRLPTYLSYQTRVAANVLDMLARQWAAQPGAHARELEALTALLGRSGDLADLNRDLCRRIEQGEMSLATPGLNDLLWEVVLGKMAVDQPRYSAYLAETGEGG
jgi:Domain of unknown function (DUF6285)